MLGLDNKKTFAYSHAFVESVTGNITTARDTSTINHAKYTVCFLLTSANNVASGDYDAI